jgi:hypothetical protein
MSDQYDETWTASAEELAALQELQDQLAAQREQTAAERAATQQQLDELAGARGEVQTQTRGLEGDVGSFRAEQKLADAAAHTAAVELAASQGGDFYSPDVGQVVAPDGTITYDFDAHLHARGLDLDAGTSTAPSPDQRVRWLRQSDGAVVADISAWSLTTPERTLSGFAHGTSTIPAHHYLGVDNPDVAGDQAYVAVDTGSGSSPPYAKARAGAGNYAVTLIDATGSSAFMRRTAPGTERVNFGRTSYTFPGGAASSPWLSVAHGLGVVPKLILLTCSAGSNDSSGYYANHRQGNDATNITFAIHAPGPPTFTPVAGTLVLVNFLAVG